jgi:hypothetical protein
MPSITTWNRIEPRARRVDFGEGLAARVHDPLWLLTRQWQLQEFRGEDGGSAVAAHLRGTAAPFTRIRLGAGGEPKPYDPQLPLEVAVEQEPDRSLSPSVRDAAEGGLVWLRMLEQNGLSHHRGAYVSHAPLPTVDPADDSRSARFRRMLAGRVPDGAALYLELAAALRPATGVGSLPPTPDVGADVDAVTVLARAWLVWWEGFAREPALGESPWQPSKFEYRFAIAAPGVGGRETVFEADEYPGGLLDWYSFRTVPAASLGAREDQARIRSVVRAVSPSPVEIPGNPASRFWEFEDGRVDLARLEAAPEDVARLLLAEFALIYGDDWLFVPVDLDAGTVFRTESLEVHDTFGTVTAIPPSISSDAPDERWGFFHVAGEPGPVTSRRQPDSLFLLPPVLAASIEGTPVEEVLLLHDEMANLAWAVERHIASSSGRSIDRAEEYQRRRAQPPAEPIAPTAPLRYVMHGRVPDHWVPLMPVHVPGSTRSVRLQRGSVRDPETGALVRPLGRILSPGTPLFVDEEEVPRCGARITRQWQYARGSDGGVHLWAGRRKRLGSREGWSGLRFDTVDRRTP